MIHRERHLASGRTRTPRGDFAKAPGLVPFIVEIPYVTLSARGVAALIIAALGLCLVSFLAGAFVSTNHPGFRNCFTPQTPCMDSSD